MVTQNTYLVGVGKVWGGLNGFGRFRESWEGFPYGRQMAAEAELLQQIFSKKFAEEYKTPHPMLNTPKM